MISPDDRKLLLTRDGSYTVEQPSLGVTFHSTHGALQESMHVFIRQGLHYLLSRSDNASISIFEMGFGTGLNALLSWTEAKAKGLHLHYTSVDLFPLSSSLIDQLHYDLGDQDASDVLKKLHQAEWNIEVEIDPCFTLLKRQIDLTVYVPDMNADLVYFDAFGPGTQPELWSERIFEKMYALLKPGGVLVTYSSKGDVRRALQAAGFIVEKLQGPPGKREMVRARKR